MHQTTAGEGKKEPRRVTRAEYAYRLVERELNLGHFAERANRNLKDRPVGVWIRGLRLALEDDAYIPTTLRGHVQVALDMNLVSAELRIEESPSGSEQTLKAYFCPFSNIIQGLPDPAQS